MKTAPRETTDPKEESALQHDAVIAIEHLSFAYNGATVLRDADFMICRRDLVSLVGPNGGGKTTLLKLMLGLLEPTRGRVRVFGGPPEKARARLGYMPQHVLFDPEFPVTVLDVALMGRQGRRWLWPYRKGDRRAACAALERVGILALRGHSFADLSGGERQRVLLARALVSDPEILLLDEPTSNVDALAEQNLHDFLRDLNETLTIVMVSHDLGFVSSFVKTVICVNRSVVVHPTSDIDGALIRDLYGGDVRLVRHDHRCAEGGHECSTR
ncbi:MAG: ABC transporter ATP-binding protein [Planctomycetota bacterium]